MKPRMEGLVELLSTRTQSLISVICSFKAFILRKVSRTLTKTLNTNYVLPALCDTEGNSSDGGDSYFPSEKLLGVVGKGKPKASACFYFILFFHMRLKS